MATLTGPGKAEEQKWMAEEDMRTMMRAEEIQKDGPRLRRMKRVAKMKMDEMQRMMKKGKS